MVKSTERVGSVWRMPATILAAMALRSTHCGSMLVWERRRGPASRE